MYERAEIRVTGEVAGVTWLDINGYSVPVTEVMERLPSVIAILRAAWNAAAREQE